MKDMELRKALGMVPNTTFGGLKPEKYGRIKRLIDRGLGNDTQIEELNTKLDLVMKHIGLLTETVPEHIQLKSIPCKPIELNSTRYNET